MVATLILPDREDAVILMGANAGVKRHAPYRSNRTVLVRLQDAPGIGYAASSSVRQVPLTRVWRM